jgi:hypothetical protein
MNPGQERIGSFGGQKGGRRKKTVRRRQKQRGGGFGLGGIVGGIGSDLSTAYATLRGVAPPPNPNPWQGQYGSGQDNLNYLQFSQNTRSPTVQTTP